MDLSGLVPSGFSERRKTESASENLDCDASMIVQDSCLALSCYSRPNWNTVLILHHCFHSGPETLTVLYSRSVQVCPLHHRLRRKTVSQHCYPFSRHRLFRHGKIRRFRDGFVKPYLEALGTHTFDGFHFRTGRTVQSKMVSWSHPTERV